MSSNEKFIVGLTGGIGSGKSAAADMFRALGVDVIDADAIAREVVEPGQPALSDIVSHFGDNLLTAQGRLDRAALRKIVFSNPDQKSWLENLLHPLIADLLQRRLNETQSPYAILESPLLFETEQHRLVARVLAIDVSEETQLSRTLDRDGGDAELIRSIIGSQIKRADRIRLADDLLPNEGNLEQLRSGVETLHRKYRKMATEQ